MAVAILVAPFFDEVTKYSFEWSREVKKWLEEAGLQVIDISGRTISRREVEEALKNNPNAIYIHYDHGSEDKHWGSKNEAVVDLKNVELLSGREVYTLNCLSAKKLGVEAWKNKAIAYWGYIEEFAFTTDALEEFKKFANYGIKLRLEGKSWNECIRLVNELGIKLSEELVEKGKYLASVLMYRNTKILRCWNTEPPSPEIISCPFRRLAIKLFGKIGYKIPRKFVIALILFGLGVGIYLHDRIVEWETLGSRLHGMDVGVAALVISFIIVAIDFIMLLKK